MRDVMERLDAGHDVQVRRLDGSRRDEHGAARSVAAEVVDLLLRHDLTLCDGSGERPFLGLVRVAILRMKSAVLPVFGGRGAQSYRASLDLLRLPVGKEQLSARSFTDDDASWHPIQHRLQPAALFFFQAEDGIRDLTVTGVQTC